jgi:ferredoxin--NADP+ reductase
VLGRRGPAQAAFTSSELRELGHLEGGELSVDPEELELDPLSRSWLESEGTFTALKNIALLREFATGPKPSDASRRIVLRFLRSPVEIRGGDRVEAVEVCRNEIIRADDGSLRPRPLDGEIETMPCGLVLRSVGYRAVPQPGVPFDEHSFVLPNDRGRVLGPDGEPLPGVYAVGWIKRGPTGVLGTNKRDAAETLGCLAEDLAADRLPAPPCTEPGRIEALLAERKPDLVTVEGWRAIDARELQRGAGQLRPRVKLASHDELLTAAGAATQIAADSRTVP